MQVQVQPAAGWQTASQSVQDMEKRRKDASSFLIAYVLDAEMRFVTEANGLIEEKLTAARALDPWAIVIRD